MYFPRATRLSLLPDLALALVWLVACGRPLTLSTARPTMIATQENDRKSRALKP